MFAFTPKVVAESFHALRVSEPWGVGHENFRPGIGDG
jgi:hypothetical protein